ncbi:hypothetical protein EA462_01760 [Natrarchaeobius halalkaliphilus]|uniref:Uncharacterized protein n=1 Tax=Natrarchaeobius halalkaliphilus TaxID=1679091 RepID=A0A3N6MGA2_9EURY|nr:hypothetical protein [Natrarchaeobius halalkaliphilus]RQG92966.1 hypothetical protein EA462_01760 [Natrarchaeobius halalkaliphilus]
MSRSWTDRVDQLLYDGERVERRVECGRATVFVTTHRVLAFEPDEVGSAYRHVDRPNVASATIRTDGATRHLLRAGGGAIVGVSLLGLHLLVSFAALVPSADLEQPDARTDSGGAVVGNAIETVEILFRMIDLAILASGLLAIAVAAGGGLLYARSRARRLVLEVRGDDDIAFAADEIDDVGAVALELEDAIRPDSSLEEITRDDADGSGSKPPTP